MTQTIHPQTTLGPASLTVADLEQSMAYYQENIGLELLHRENSQARLGTGGKSLLRLTEMPGATLASRVTGLYHFALLLPSRFELARTLQHLIETRTPFSGFADHNVSEAMYLQDPDGHGIEIYRDRPRQEWTYINGRLHMTTDPFDAEGILAELAGGSTPWTGIHPDTVMGHMHLHVSDLNAAEQFYTQVLGFDLVLRYGPSASFVSAGGYHHHIGMNTWAGVGVPPPPPDALSLQWYEICLPDTAALNEVIERIESTNLPYNETDMGISVADPSANRILLTVK